MAGWRANERTLCVGLLPGRKNPAIYEEVLGGVKVLGYLKPDDASLRVRTFLDELGAAAFHDKSRITGKADAGAD